MIESGPPAAAPAMHADHGENGHAPGAISLQLVEDRLRRLEDAVAALQERPPLPSPQPHAGMLLPHVEAASRPEPGPADVLRETGRRLLPLAVGVLHGSSAEPSRHTQTSSPPRTWLVVEALDELRLIVRMFTDRRYRVSWPAVLVPVCVLFLMIGSSMLLGGIPLVGSSIAKVIDLLLSFFVYKVLTREAHRYRDEVPYLSDPSPMRR